MLNNFFILIGGSMMSLVSFLKNLSFSRDSNKTDSSKINSEILLKLNQENNLQTTQQETKLDKIREDLLYYLLKKHVMIILAIGFVLTAVLTNWELGAMYLVLIAMLYIFVLFYPQMKEQHGYDDLNQELPYALRHMSIELKAGRGLHDALITIKNADYGSLSKEFNRVLEEVKFGKSTEDSLMDMSHRVNSDGLTRAIHQIVGTQRVGGNLAGSLEIIAQDISFDMQIKLKEFSQKLNSVILIYTFIAILAPVICLIMLMAASTVMGDIISSELLYVIYTIFFPMIVMFMGLFIKKLEPKI